MLCLAAPPAGTQPHAVTLSDFKLVRTVNLAGQTFHVQGVDFRGDRMWLTSVDRPREKGFLFEFSLANGALVKSIEVGDGVRYHAGGIATGGASIWIPVAEYRPRSSAWIEQRSQKTLELESRFEVDDHIGCLAATPDALIGGNWDSKDFYVWDHSGKLIRKVASTTGNAYQDMKYDNGWIVASGNLPDRTGAIDWLEWPSLRMVRRLPAGKNDRGVLFTREAMSVHGNRLVLVPEDGASRLFEFDLAGWSGSKK